MAGQGGGGPVRARILVQVTIYRRLRIGGDVHLDQSETYDILQLVYVNTGPGVVVAPNDTSELAYFLQIQMSHNASAFPASNK